MLQHLIHMDTMLFYILLNEEHSFDSGKGIKVSLSTFGVNNAPLPPCVHGHVTIRIVVVRRSGNLFAVFTMEEAERNALHQKSMNVEIVFY